MELTGIKTDTNDMMLDDLFQYYMDKTGYKKLGSGLTGVILKHPTKNEVLRFWFDDIGYEDFLNYATTHKSKYLVKVLSKPKTLKLRTKNVKDNVTHKTVKYVRLEYLTPYNENMKIFGIPFDKVKTLLAAIGGKGHKETLAHNASNIIDDDEIYKLLGLNIKKLDLKGFREFINVYVDIMRSVPETDIWADLHDKNIMMRGDIPVIIDPLTDDGSIDSTQFFLASNAKNPNSISPRD